MAYGRYQTATRRVSQTSPSEKHCDTAGLLLGPLIQTCCYAVIVMKISWKNEVRLIAASYTTMHAHQYINQKGTKLNRTLMFMLEESWPSWKNILSLCRLSQPGLGCPWAADVVTALRLCLHLAVPKSRCALCSRGVFMRATCQRNQSHVLLFNSTVSRCIASQMSFR